MNKNLKLKFFAFTGVFLLFLIALDVFVGAKTSFYISRIDGSTLQKKSFIFPIFGRSPMEIAYSKFIRDTPYSRFLSNEKESKHNWLRFMFKVDSLILRDTRISPTPDLSIRYPIRSGNPEMIYLFLTDKFLSHSGAWHQP